jgi:O-antigen/teichoic acid export membrane protein
LGFVTIPRVLSVLGTERFGLLTLVWTAIGYFGLFDFGLGRVLTQQVASRLAKTGRLVRSDVLPGLKLVWVFGVLGALVMWGLSWYYIQFVLHLPLGMVEEALTASAWASASIPLVSLGSGLRGILEGREEFGKAGWLRGLLGGLNFGLPWMLVVLGLGYLVPIVLSLVLARLVVVAWNAWWLRSLWKAEKQEEFGEEQSSETLLRFGAWMTLSNVVGPFMVAADRFFVASAVGAGLLAYYTVPQDAVLRLLVIPAAWATVWFPRFSGLVATASPKAFRELLWQGLRWVALVMGALCLGLGLFAGPLLSLWLDAGFAENASGIAQIMLVGIFFNALAHIPLAALQASGRVALTAKLHVLELLLFVPTLLWVLGVAGLWGAAWVWTARTVFDCVFLLGFSVKNNDGSKL